MTFNNQQKKFTPVADDVPDRIWDKSPSEIENVY